MLTMAGRSSTGDPAADTACGCASGSAGMLVGRTGSISGATPRARLQVRAVTGGDETVPTVVVEGQSFVNPDPGWLRAHLLDAERTGNLLG